MKSPRWKRNGRGFKGGGIFGPISPKFNQERHGDNNNINFGVVRESKRMLKLINVYLHGGLSARPHDRRVGLGWLGGVGGCGGLWGGCGGIRGDSQKYVFFRGLRNVEGERRR